MHTKIGGLGNNNSDVNETGKKAIGLNWKKHDPACASPFLVQFSLPSLHDYHGKMPNFTFFLPPGFAHKTAPFFFFY